MSDAEQPLGEVTRDGEQVRVRFVRHLRHPPARVWEALTTSAHLAHWMPCDIVGDRVVGARLAMPFWPETRAKYGLDDEPLAGELLAWEPLRRFEFRWDTEVVRFELEPDGDGTRLRLTTWLTGEVPTEDAASGYHLCLGLLAERLDGGTGSTATIDNAPMKRRYAEMLGVA